MLDKRKQENIKVFCRKGPQKAQMCILPRLMASLNRRLTPVNVITSVKSICSQMCFLTFKRENSKCIFSVPDLNL